MMNDECRNDSASVAYAMATVWATTISPAIDPRLGQNSEMGPTENTTVGNASAYDCWWLRVFNKELRIIYKLVWTDKLDT